MSISELETLHHLCEIERKQLVQSHALAVLKTTYLGYLLSGNRSNFIEYDGKSFSTTNVLKSLTTT